MQLQVGLKIALRNQEGKYLVLKRNFDKYPDMKTTDAWDLVGGRIQTGLSLLDNLRREIKEETDLGFTGQPRLIAHQDILRPDKHVVRLTFIADMDGQPKLSEEHAGFAWLSVDELLAHPELDPFLREVLTKHREEF